jgi:hypothetical protein
MVPLLLTAKACTLDDLPCALGLAAGFPARATRNWATS